MVDDITISKKINDYIADINNFKVQHNFSLEDKVIINPEKTDILCMEFKKHNLYYSINLKKFLKTNQKEINKGLLIGVITGFSFDKSIIQVTFKNSDANANANANLNHDIYWFYYDNLLPLNNNKLNNNKINNNKLNNDKLNIKKTKQIIKGGDYKNNKCTIKNKKNIADGITSTCLCKKKIKKSTMPKSQLKALEQNAIKNSSDIYGNKIDTLPINPIESIGNVLLNFKFIGNERQTNKICNKCISNMSGGDNDKKYYFSATDMEKNLQAIIYIFIKLLKILVKTPIFKLCYYVVINAIYKFIITFKDISTTFQNANNNSNSKLLFIHLTTPLCISTEYFISTNFINKITDKIRIFTNNIDIASLSHISRYLINISKQMTKLLEDTCYARGQMLISNNNK